MKQSLSMLCLTVLLLGAFDLVVSGVLSWAEPRGKLGSLVRYFEYGRSVPGKIERWETAQARQYEFGWMGPIIAKSADGFANEGPAAGPVIRTYGMSFVNNIMTQIKTLSPEQAVDLHSGPAAPPNYTYALFVDDAAYRKPGDVAVLGILSSSIPAMASLGNRSWAFEQPLPFTYPIFRPDGDGLRRITPLITTSAAERGLSEQSGMAAGWAAQLIQEDAFYSPITFGAVWLDHSPFARLVRRALAKGHIARSEAQILSGSFPYREVLHRIITRFSSSAEQAGQIPVVMLIQTGDLGETDLLALLRPFLKEHGIPYFATAEHFDPRDPSGFIEDGHYRKGVDRRFAEAFLKQLAPLMAKQSP